jgi:hypothetical protein
MDRKVLSARRQSCGRKGDNYDLKNYEWEGRLRAVKRRELEHGLRTKGKELGNTCRQKFNFV